MSEAVIVDAVRTPIGRAVKGSLGTYGPTTSRPSPRRPSERNQDVDLADVVDVMYGRGRHRRGRFNVARNAALLAGLPESVPGVTVNRFCASSLQTIRNAFHAIKAGEGDTYIAGGVEAISRSTEGGPSSSTRRSTARRLDHQRLHPDGIDRGERGGALQRLARVAGRVGRDLAAARRGGPGQRALRQRDRQRHAPDGTVVSADDGPRAGTTLEKLASLNPVFKEGGTVTAGNACPLNDGAAAVLVMSEEKAASLGKKPRARIVASTVAAIDPEYMGVGPIPAIQCCSSRSA